MDPIPHLTSRVSELNRKVVELNRKVVELDRKVDQLLEGLHELKGPLGQVSGQLTSPSADSRAGDSRANPPAAPREAEGRGRELRQPGNRDTKNGPRAGTEWSSSSPVEPESSRVMEDVREVLLSVLPSVRARSHTVKALSEYVEQGLREGGHIRVQNVGAASDEEWRVLVFSPAELKDGWAVVHPGLAADRTIAEFFGVKQGERVLACIEPAKVRVSGSDFRVLNQGRVKCS